MRLTRRQFGAGTIATLLGGVSRASAQQAPIKIGAVNPYTGPMALYGDEVTRGFELAADWVNAQGGVLGRKIEIVRGSAASAQEGIAAVEQLVGRDKVDLLTGTLSRRFPTRRARAHSTTPSSTGRPTRSRAT